MGTALSTYFGLTRVREMSPDARDWIATDGNIEAISKILKAFEQHSHNGAAALTYPGYNSGTPADPTEPVLSQFTSGGILTPGTTVAVRLSYLNALGLETDSGPEVAIDVGAATTRPLAPTLSTTTIASPGLAGGTYIYVVTKRKSTGETLPSDILPVTLGYDALRSITIAFNPISSYTDGTDLISIYRANGLNAAFQLVGTVTSAGVSTFTDNGTITAGNQNIQPPTTNTFDAARKVRINWVTLTPHPAGASKLRVYITQQTGIWGNRCLLIEYDLAASPPTFVDYLGSEALQPGTPLAATQIPTSSPKINLSTETTGAPTLTANMDFNTFAGNNFKTGGNPTVTKSNGMFWYDSSVHQFKAHLNGGDITLAQAGASFSHGAESSGGHIAANIPYAAGQGSIKTALDRIAVSTTGANKQVITPVVSTATTNNTSTTQATQATGVYVAEMLITSPAIQITNQWLDISFGGQFKLSAENTTLNLILEVNGVALVTYQRSFTSGIANQNFPMDIKADYQVTGAAATTVPIKVLWWVTGTTTATAIGLQRSLRAKLVL